MALSNVQTSSLDPSQLRPAGPPSTTPLGVQGGEGTGQMITQTPMKGPDGRTYVMQQVGNSAPSFISEGPDGGTISYQPGANGTYNEGRFDRRSFGQAVFGDKKLMAFLAVATAGAAAAYAGGAGAAGGASASGAGAAGGAGTAGAGAAGGAAGGTGLTYGGAGAAGGMGGGTGLTFGGAGAAGGAGGAGSLGTGFFASEGVGLAGAGGAAGAGGLASAGGSGGGASGGGGGFFDQAGNFISDNANWLAPLAGGVAGGLAGMKDQKTSFDRNETTSSQMQGGMSQQSQGGMSQSTNSSMQGQTGLVDYAQGAGRAYAGMAQDTINGKYLNMQLGTNPFAEQDNPYLKSAMDNVATRMTDNYKNGVASQSMGQFAANGAFGGSAHQQFMEGQNRAFGDSLGSAMTGMQMQDYTQRANLKEGQLGRDLNWGINERNNMMNSSGGLSNLGSTQSQNSSQNTTGTNFQNTTGTNWQNSNGTSNVTGTQTTPGVGFWQGAAGGGLAGWGAYQQSQQPQGGLGMQDPYMQRTVKAY